MKKRWIESPWRTQKRRAKHWRGAAKTSDLCPKNPTPKKKTAIKTGTQLIIKGISCIVELTNETLQSRIKNSISLVSVKNYSHKLEDIKNGY